jgi:hypothetical protein
MTGTLALAACAVDGTGTSGPEAVGQNEAPLVSVYSYQGSVLEISGRPLQTGSFAVTMRLETPSGTRSVDFDPQASGEEIVPALKQVYQQMGADMVTSVRNTIASTSQPSTESEARWMWMQQSLFGAAQSEHQVADDVCSSIGGNWQYCGNDGYYHCCVFAHTSICDFLCSLL